MASIKKTPSGSFQIRITSKLLPKACWATFDTYEQADSYARQLEGLLAQGVVPASLLTTNRRARETWSVPRCVAKYIRHNDVPLSDVKLLDTVVPTMQMLNTSGLTYDWA
ncbi:hypothetical protein [Massilia sp. PWRC2]|uniref:hypothetical protein n=1 Tax=Massilia sp. PWRC2 TaxID=2804626 RepID=UPI003CEA644F